MNSRLAIASTNVVTLSNLQDAVVGTYLESSTVVVTLYDAAGNPVTGATAISMTKVVGTSGASTLYRGTFPSTVTLTGQTYNARVTITDAVGVLRIDEPALAS